MALRSHHNRRRGQTLVEFAAVLPILLIMIFGIIEFGRMFQAWVSLQNAARAAARYASTGNVNYELFDAAEDIEDDDDVAIDIIVMNDVVPCGSNVDGPDVVPDVPDPSGALKYGGDDGFFATWYGGIDCEPTDEDHRQLRKDLLRLVSIMNEARESVNALSVESRNPDLHYYESLSAEEVQNLMYEYWMNPMPRENQRGWFNVGICSTRGLQNAGSLTRNTVPPYNTSRFVLVRTPADAGGDTVYPIPFCMMNEIPVDTVTGQPAPNSAGKRWLDAGGPGDTVTVVVTFNHPLITPLRTGVENYMQMQARRSIVNESFRAPKAVGVFQRSLPPGNSGKPGNIETPDPTATGSATDTETPTPTPSNTPTATLEPFSCENLSVGWGSPPFDGNRLYLLIENNNYVQVELTRVTLSWRNLPSPNDKMYLGVMGLGLDVHWTGTPASMNTSVAGRTSVDTGQLTQGYRFISAQGNSTWEGIYFQGPSNLAEFMTLYDVDSQFTFVARPPGQPVVTCVVTKTNPDGLEPTEPPPPTIGPSPSPTPNCVQSANRVKLEFGGFDTLGGVYFNLINNSGRDLLMQGFKFYWPDATHPAIAGEPAGGYRLTRVIVGGDTVTSNGGQRVWQGNVTKGNTSTNPAQYNNPTFGGATMGQGAAVGTWIANGTLKAGTTRIWLDFDGFTDSMFDFGARPWHFDKAKLYFGCRGGGGSGGGGDSSDGDIEAPIPSPSITNTPKPTNTRGPSNTPGPATASRTPTITRTPAPATATHTRAPITLTPSRTPFGQPTENPQGGGE
jgi:hypothetical protein